MKKRVFPRLVLALFVSAVAFVLLSAMQFARYGNFTRQVGGMTISGRQLSGDGADFDAARLGRILLDGTASLSFAGLEFQLGNTGNGGGLSIVDSEGARHPVSPEFVYMAGGMATFSLPFGIELSFSNPIPDDMKIVSPETMPELRIAGAFSEGVASVEIPFRPKRSSIAWDNSRGILAVTYEGVRHMFSRNSQELAAGRLVISAVTPVVSYRIMPEVIVNNPADFAIPGMENAPAFSSELTSWTERNFENWGSNMASGVYENRVIALGAEALQRGIYAAVMSNVPASFGTGPNVTWESAVYQFDRRAGVWNQAVRNMVSAESAKTNAISGMLARNDFAALFEETGLFGESGLVEFLAVRGNDTLLNGILAAARNIDPSTVTLGMSAGILESLVDLGKWRPGADNPFEPLAVRARAIVADCLRQNGNQVLVFSRDGIADVAMNLRIGRALREWGERARAGDDDDEWAALGRSLVVSSLSLAKSFPDGDAESLPAFITSGPNGNLTASDERIGSATVFRTLNNNEFLPRAKATGTNGMWAWTVARSVGVSQIANFMDITVDFQSGQSHYVMLRGVRPFVLLQMHGQNTARNPSFEGNLGVSGWDYFEDEQTLVLKIQHRADVERVRVFFTIPAPVVAVPTTQAVSEPEVAAPVQTDGNIPALPPIRPRPPTWTPPPGLAPQD